MKRRVQFPLMAKMLMWLLLHLAVLAGAFAVFVGWQLQLGLDSLLSGASGDRLKALGSGIAAELRESPRTEWPGIVESHTESYGVQAVLLIGVPKPVVGEGIEIPPDIDERMRSFARGKPGGGGDGARPQGPGDRLGPPGSGADRPLPPRRGIGPDSAGPGPDSVRQGPDSTRQGPETQPLFLTRASSGDGYWAGIDLPLFRPGRDRPLHGMLLLRSDDPSAGGLFFDLRPWLLGGLAVLAVSLLLWAPFVLGITRYASRLSKVTDQIAQGHFESRVGRKRRDELGSVGESIERMSDRLDHLLRGQKRFLGDVAHELCSPLARIRTGLGILDHKLSADSEKERLASIEEDVEELSELVSEVLAFTRAETAPESVKYEAVKLREMVEMAMHRECPGHSVELALPEDLEVSADRRLLGRAIANIMRNANRHGGADCRIAVRARKRKSSNDVLLTIGDSGPGVAAEDAEKLFEPFFRPDTARTREAGGVGLGLAIVRSAVEACGGSIRAGRSDLGGLEVRIELAAV
ncbi:histidine kinase [Haloferula helveola]|uniref:histidine kinase n=1 Tax=Haloferula helveola TaxID=490095 RepID=A0ABM7RAI8_9BACT|nr:histidine kinase [Haloferula helveola]